MKKLAIICADGMEEVEALTAVDLLRRARIGCDMLALDGGEQVRGSHEIVIRMDGRFPEARWESYDGLILPGGKRGTERLRESGALLALLRDFHARGKLCTAICAAPTVLGKAGLLRGRRACCYPGMEEGLTGAEVRYDPVTVDGDLITSRGLGTAIPFALAIVAYFRGREEAARLAEKVVYSWEEGARP